MFFNKIASLKKAAMLGFVIAAFSTSGNTMEKSLNNSNNIKAINTIYNNILNIDCRLANIEKQLNIHTIPSKGSSEDAKIQNNNIGNNVNKELKEQNNNNNTKSLINNKKLLENNELYKRIHNLEIQINDIQKLINSDKKSIKESLDNIGCKFSTRDSYFDKRIEDTQKSIKKSLNNIGCEFSTRDSYLDKRIEDTQKSIKKSLNNIGCEFSTRDSYLDKRIDKTNTQINILTGECIKNEKEIRKLQNTIIGLEGTNKILMKKNEDLEKKLNNLINLNQMFLMNGKPTDETNNNHIIQCNDKVYNTVTNNTSTPYNKIYENNTSNHVNNIRKSEKITYDKEILYPKSQFSFYDTKTNYPNL